MDRVILEVDVTWDDVFVELGEQQVGGWVKGGFEGVQCREEGGRLSKSRNFHSLIQS